MSNNCILGGETLDQSDQSGVGEKQIELGKRIEIDCRSPLSPPVSYAWSKVHGSIPMGATIRGSTLILSKVQAEDAGIYICKTNNSQTFEETSTVLSVTHLVPFFDQSPLSYLELDTLDDAYLDFEVDISFKPEDPNGKYIICVS
jgi:hypothetical protein